MPKRIRRWSSLAWLILPTLVVAVFVLISVLWRAPAEIEVSATASSVQFRGRGQDKQLLLQSTNARWLALQGFAEIKLIPKAVWIADPAQHNFQEDTYPPGAWHPLPIGQSLVLRPSGRGTPAVTIQPLGKSGSSLSIGEIFVGPIEVAIRSPEKGNLTIELQGQQTHGDVPLPQEFRIDADLCVAEGLAPDPSDLPVTYRILLGPDSRLLEYDSQLSGMRLAIGYPGDGKESFLGKAGFAVDRIRFSEQGPIGEPESSLAGSGTIDYAHYPSAGPIPLQSEDFLSLSDSLSLIFLPASLPTRLSSSSRRECQLLLRKRR